MALATLSSIKQLPSKFEKFAIISIENTECTMGRSLESSISIPFIGLSRNHCTFKKYTGSWTINDHSSFGITVNDNVLPKNADYPIKNGDTIKMEPRGFFIYRFNHFDTPSTTEEERNAKIHPILSCSICNELFHKACIIKCGHTYCTYCINQWKKKSKTCPLCRCNITNITPVVMIDELVQECVSNLSDEERLHRETEINSRKVTSKRSREEDDSISSRLRRSKRGRPQAE